VEVWRCVGSGDDWKEECELLASMSFILLRLPLYSLMYLEVLTASCPCTRRNSAVSHSESAVELLYKLEMLKVAIRIWGCC